MAFINDYCYAQGTYFVPLDVAEPWRSHERVPVDYYQWASLSYSCCKYFHTLQVPYLFIAQALLFYMPHVLYRNALRICGVDVVELCDTINEQWSKVMLQRSALKSVRFT